MFEVHICHSPAERGIAGQIAARLERGAEARIRLDECDSVPVAWEGGTDSGAILLLLSPGVVPPRATRESWQALLEHIERNSLPPVATLLVGPCAYPKLLEQRPFFRWSDDPVQTLRALELWARNLNPPDEAPAFEPARLPWFRGREAELEQLWRRLVDDAGMGVLYNPAPGSGKTSLAQEFARAAAAHFSGIGWADCSQRTAASIRSGLTPLRGRLLVVLDDVTGEWPILDSPDGRQSVLLTTRRAGSPLPDHAEVLEIESCAVSAPGRTPAHRDELRLWQSMSACRRNGAPVELAARIAGTGEGQARALCARLVEQRLADPLDARGAWYRLRTPSPEEGLDEFRRRHAEILCGSFAARDGRWAAEFDLAFPWALRSDWNLATRLARCAFTLLRDRDRFDEAAPVYDRLREAALERQDEEVLRECSWELSWIRDESGGIRRPSAMGDQLALDFS